MKSTTPPVYCAVAESSAQTRTAILKSGHIILPYRQNGQSCAPSSFIAGRGAFATNLPRGVRPARYAATPQSSPALSNATIPAKSAKTGTTRQSQLVALLTRTVAALGTADDLPGLIETRHRTG